MTRQPRLTGHREALTQVPVYIHREARTQNPIFMLMMGQISAWLDHLYPGARPA
jgi:hypothetical protein